jgi:SAM-dependent methyltransferase
VSDDFRAAYGVGVDGWATGASLVYAPLAEELVATSPHPLAGRLVLDTGAGTGVGSAALRRVGADVMATDLTPEMLAHHRAERPPSTAADVVALPHPDDAFDDSLAAFVLNHLAEPVAGLRELARVTRSGGAVIAATFSSESQHDGRDRVDEVAAARGFGPPEWYVEMKASIMPLLGSADAMADAAADAGLVDVEVDERPVDVGVTRAEDLVAYRLGQANYADYVAALGEDERRELFRAAVEAVGQMEPYRPIVVFLRATSA